MKKLLFIVFALIVFTSCTTQTVNKTDLPIEVVKLKESNQFDTTYTISTDKKVFLFDDKKEYVGAYKIENDDSGLFYVGLFIGFLVLLFFIVFLKD
jgi:hypothetical protein